MSIFGRAFSAIAGNWYQMKLLIEQTARISHDSIHVLVGGVAPLVIAFLTRRSVASWLPWLVMLALILFNETVDVTIEIWPGSARLLQYGDSLKDILLTMALPTVLLVSARVAPQLYARR